MIVVAEKCERFCASFPGMIKVFASPVSTCSRKVLMTLMETDTPFELSLVNLAKGEHKQQPHLARQPFGQIPAIDDEGFALFEARAICRYLSAKAGDQLTPGDLQQRATMDLWTSVEQSYFSANAMKFIYHYTFKRPQEAAVLEAAQVMLHKVFAVAAKPLGVTPFFAGEKLTIADIVYMPYVQYLMQTPVKETIDQYPQIVSWWSRVSTRDSWPKVLALAVD